MEKYQKLFFERMDKRIKQWEAQGEVKEKDLYSFFHILKGTAASIGLEEMSKIAERQLVRLSHGEERLWSMNEWQQLLKHLSFIKPNNVIEEIEQESVEKLEKIVDNEKLLLLVDDDITIIDFLKDKFEEEGYMVLAALNAERALQLFYDQKPDCILLDINLPDKSGLEVLDIILEKAQTYFIPIILLSAEDNKKIRMKGYSKGAVDFIAKPFDKDELLVRLENRIKYREIVSNAVLIDELTGAFNRKFFKIELSRYLFEMQRTKDILSLVVVDLDHFKKVNDTHGHLVGDEVLKGFAQFVMKNKRNSDYLIRFGGEEFILILPHTKGEDAVAFTERLIKDFKEMPFQGIHEEPFHVTFSGGVVEINDPNIQIEEYLNRADTALYDAKESGRKQARLYSGGRGPAQAEKLIRIGIIDDDKAVRQLLNVKLSKLTYGDFTIELNFFSDGEAFFESEWHRQKGKFLILLDGIMPKMDGIEVLKKLRSEYDEQKFIVLMLTGRSAEKDIVKALELGADDYLVKPFSMKELEARVKRLIKRMLIK